MISKGNKLSFDCDQKDKNGSLLEKSTHIILRRIWTEF